MKAPATVSKAAAKSGAMAYDPITLATKFAGMFPLLKDEIKNNINTYGEFLCEDFFVNHANKYIMDAIRSNNPQQMKKVFNILGEVYEDGTNEVQSLIAVTILGEIKNDPVIIQRIIPYLTDTMLEPVLAANERLAKSKSSQLRLQNPPKYKPKKQKKPGFLSQLMGGGGLLQGPLRQRARGYPRGQPAHAGRGEKGGLRIRWRDPPPRRGPAIGVPVGAGNRRRIN